MLKELVGATTIIKHILDLDLNLTISKFYILALAIEK